MPARTASRRSAKLVGRSQPRLFTPPLRPLNRRTSRGYEVIEFAQLIGEPLLPWQAWLVKHAMELLPDSTYRFRIVLVLVARQNGKSSLKRIVTLWRLYMDGARTVLGLAQDVALAREQWTLCQDTIHDCPDLEAEWGGVRNVNGDEKFWLRGGGRYMIRAMNRKAGRGYSIDEANIDELREQHDWKAWSAVSKTLMARENAQLWAMSNAGDDESVVLNQLRDAALAGRDPSIGLFEWSAPDGCELDDPRGWAQANPGLGHVMGALAVRGALATDPPDVFRTEVLCQRVAHLDAAVDVGAWKACTDATGSLRGQKDRLAAVVDVAPDGGHVTLAAAAVTDDGRVRVQVIKAWRGTDEARFELGDILDKVQAVQEGWFPGGPAARLAPILRARPNQVELTGGKVGEACQGLADLATTRRVVHPGDPLLDAHVAGASKLYTGDGWRFVRRGAGHVDAAYAAAGACYLAQTLPQPSRQGLRILTY
ncbi:MAG TPA: terminase [Actinomycetes bacterium]|nr:terminase [Actinomycetes bacterium]